MELRISFVTAFPADSQSARRTWECPWLTNHSDAIAPQGVFQVKLFQMERAAALKVSYFSIAVASDYHSEKTGPL